MTDRLPNLIVQMPEETRVIATSREDAGVALTQVLRRHGLPLNTRCGDRGLCQGCTVRLAQGTLEGINGGPVRDAGEEDVRACQLAMHAGDDGGDVELVVPERSITRFAAHAVDDFVTDVPHAHDPLWQEENGLESLRDGEGGGVGVPIGVAVDVGTTTLAIMLVDLTDGRILTRAGAFNRQVDYGDNVLTRINLCRVDPSKVAVLQDAVVNQTLAVLLEEAMREAGVRYEQIVCFTAAGNPTMLHLLAGEDPSPMGVVPFTPVFLEHRAMSVSEVGLRHLHQEHAARNGEAPPMIHLLPSGSAYVGADLSAGVVASGMRYRPETCLLIDIGTNGEMILSHEGQLIGCATAAGPAFEGGCLTAGVRAGDGAISHLSIQTDPLHIEAEVIAHSRRPIGLCGSAYIDLLAEGVRHGLLTATGRFNFQQVPEAMTLPADPKLCKGRGLVIASSPGHHPIVVWESDIASLLSAKAAIAAGVLILLESVGLTPVDVGTVFLAGGFGRHVNVAHAIGAGLLPGFCTDQVRLVGNLSLAGAYLALLDRSLLEAMADVARSTRVIELNEQPGFEECFIDQLSLTPPPPPPPPETPPEVSPAPVDA